jgi:transglutaminase-like putative cysteine protease
LTEVRIVHRTTYRYARPVRFTTHRVMLRPRDSHDLRLRGTRWSITPAATSTRWAHDVFSNSVCYLDWNGVQSNTLEIVSTLELDHLHAGAAAPQETLDPSAELYPFRYSAEEFPDLARLMERQFPDPGRIVDKWARRFVSGDGPVHTMALLAKITQAIKDDFIYEARAQEGTNPPVVTLATKRGACRDFALLMMEAVRALGFAARFVSGYLYDDGAGNATVGGGATHAWCAVYLPGAGWVEYDPTNGLMAGRNLIRVCSARTPEQAVPVAGGFIGGERDFIRLSVDVQVTVGALPAPDAPRGPPEPLAEPMAPALTEAPLAEAAAG